MEDARPCDQGSNTVEAETPDEDRLEAIVSQDPVCMAKRCEGVGAEVGRLQTSGASTVNTERDLEMLVECVEEPV